MIRKPLIHLIAAAILLLVLVAAYSAWYVVVDQENSKAQALATQIQLQSQDTARIAAAKAALTSLSGDESMVNQHFVSTSDVVPFLETLQSTGSSLGSKVEMLSVSASQGKSRGQLALALQITGSFDSVMRTLGALEYAPYDITAGSITLNTPGGNGKGARIWQASGTFTVGTASSTPSAARLPAPSSVVVPSATTTSPAVTPQPKTPGTSKPTPAS